MPALKGYSLTQIRLHWIVTALVLFQLVFGEAIAKASWQIHQGETPAFNLLVPLHILAGVTILVLVVWRLVLRTQRGVPPPPEDEAPPLRTAAHVAHLAFYALLILAPITGLAAWFGGVGPAFLWCTNC